MPTKLILFLTLICASSLCFAEDQPHPCRTDPAYKKLDFWVGDWNVFADNQKDGTNLIEKILDGCAVRENWKDVTGHEGQSIFYYNPATKVWKQVWITDVGPMKEKTLIQDFPDGGVRFQGEIAKQDGTKYFDRTTLTPLPQHQVRQVIEVSKNGTDWNTVYDAIYKPK